MSYNVMENNLFNMPPIMLRRFFLLNNYFCNNPLEENVILKLNTTLLAFYFTKNSKLTT